MSGIQWDVPADCPNRAAFVELVERKSGGRALDPASMNARVRAARQPDGSWRMTITTENGERNIDAGSCESGADAAALVLAIAIAGQSPPSEPAGEPSPPKVDSVSETTPPANAAADSNEKPFKLGIGGAGALTTGIFPAPAFGFTFGISGEIRRWRLEARGAYWPVREFSFEQSPGVSSPLRFGGWSAGARGCFHWGSVWQVGPCAGGEINSMFGHAAAPFESLDGSTAWPNLLFGLHASFKPASWIRFKGDIDGVLPLARTRFVVQGLGAVHEPAAVGFRTELGAEFIIF